MDKIFEYEALVESGENIKGVFEGNEESFSKMASRKKLTIINIKEIKQKRDKTKFKADDFLDFIEELYYLSNSGMSIDESLKILIKTAKKESQVRILKFMLSELKNGAQLSVALKNALKKENVSIDSLSIGFISTAEEVGDVSQGLLQLFKYLTFQKKIKSDVFQALAYPAFLIVMSIGVSLLIFFLIIPRFSTIFTPEEFAKLPTISYAVLSTGKYLNAHASSFFMIFFTLIILAYIVSKKINIPWISIIYRLPKLSTVVIDLQLTIVYSALSTMLTGGLELDKALRQIQKINLLPELKNLLTNAHYEIKRGQKFSAVFAISKVIPPSDIALLHVGENSASLDKVFQSLSVRHSDSFSISVKKLLSLLEPIVIVGLGIFIAVIVVAIMMAVMSTTDIVS